MNEKPILFNAEMVNAILSGRKTQTRRIISEKTLHLFDVAASSGECHPIELCDQRSQSYYLEFCPLGKTGDQLWVRETFALLGNEDGVCVDWQDNMVKDDEQAAARIYKASCEQKHGDYGLYSIPDSAYWKPETSNMKYEGSWRPSIHMPRWASRINLLITGVRVERLNDISDLDCCDEGYNGPAVTADNQWPSITWYERLWDSIYGQKEGENWQANPWVWVIEFERMEAK
ncbi:hypothetical protein [Yersinia kristensenii]|uniref:hypothetical protein n=1 Tax=Yersinia kristensenii TaxID=28152 RepID=UPI001561FF44|nr:hypothetical protein [Yersinia kristensenii]QKJ16641.1 hypothetical protein HRD70_16485 [Yersinia kristensenii]